jgi:hypothetical protein
VDWAIAPFVRQFVAVDATWFAVSSYESVRVWLSRLLSSKLFTQVMVSHPVWHAGDADVVF